MKMGNKRKSVAVGCCLGWLVPGGGHFYAGEKLRGIMLFVLVTGLFSAGIAMKGGIFSPAQDFVSRFCMLGRLGAGLPWLIAVVGNVRNGNMLSHFGEIGACFTTVAGLLNFFIVLRIKDLIQKQNA